ncbi:MAG: enoyl-CoA hydratase/isomerase family protein [Deltaproteobacteria bacterium]|nr:enoyl-CoA hydratase/isomerase family protein [Deltaproteobacteria bacterium]
MKCRYDVDEKGIAILKIDNPPLNAIDEDVLNDLERSLRDIADDPAVKVVIITGEGMAFIAGADIKKMQEINTASEAESMAERGQSILNLIEHSQKPVIAAINGLALGGGTELALACHIRIGAQSAQMGLPEVRLGILPGFGGTQRSARLLGSAKAMELMLTGAFIGMAEAEKIGLVNAVVPDASLLEEAGKLAGKIASKGQLAVRAIVTAVVEGLKMPLAEGLKMERTLLGRLAESADKKEGVAAFIEKRKPVFMDR